MSLCVVIPTCNREDVLKQVLRALEKQTVKPDNIIIVDDSLEKGPAAARNKAILQSKEDLLLFINDDTIPENNNFIENHLKFSKLFPKTAILGKLKWHKDTPNNFLKGYFTHKLGFFVCSGDKDCLKNPVLDYTQYCTANLLVPRKILLDCLFNEGFTYPTLEDTEWGYRLQKKGVFLRYNPTATVLHYHKYNPDMIEKRQERIGVSLVRLIKLHPELEKVYGPRLSKTLCDILYFASKTPAIKLLPPDLKYFLVGLLTKYKSYWNQS